MPILTHIHHTPLPPQLSREATSKGRNTSTADQLLAAKEALVGMGRRTILETPLSIEVAIALIKRQLEVEHIRICYSNEFRNKERGKREWARTKMECLGN